MFIFTHIHMNAYNHTHRFTKRKVCLCVGEIVTGYMFIRRKCPKYIRSLYNFIEKLKNLKGEKEG